MKKALVLLVGCCFLLSACDSAVAGTSSPSSLAPVSSAAPEQQPQLQQIEVPGGDTVEILYEEWPPDIRFDGEPFIGSSHIYEKDGILYYLSLKDRYYSINQRDLQTGEEKVLYTTNEDVVEEFVVLDSGKILLWVEAPDLSEGGGIPPRRTGRLYLYDMQTGAYENVGDKFGLEKKGVFDFCANSQGIYIQANHSDFDMETDLYFIDKDENAHTIWENAFLECTADGNVYFRDQKHVIYAVNPAMEQPVPLFGVVYPPGGSGHYGGRMFFSGSQAIFYAPRTPESVGEISTFDLKTKQQEPTITVEAWGGYGTVVTPADDGFSCLYTTDSPRAGPDSIWDSVRLQCFDLQGNVTKTFPPFQLKQDIYFMWYCVVGDSVYYLEETTGLDEDDGYRYIQVSLSLAQLQAR